MAKHAKAVSLALESRLGLDAESIVRRGDLASDKRLLTDNPVAPVALPRAQGVKMAQSHREKMTMGAAVPLPSNNPDTVWRLLATC